MKIISHMQEDSQQAGIIAHFFFTSTVFCRHRHRNVCPGTTTTTILTMTVVWLMKPPLSPPWAPYASTSAAISWSILDRLASIDLALTRSSRDGDRTSASRTACPNAVLEAMSIAMLALALRVRRSCVAATVTPDAIPTPPPPPPPTTIASAGWGE